MVGTEEKIGEEKKMRRHEDKDSCQNFGTSYDRNKPTICEDDNSDTIQSDTIQSAVVLTVILHEPLTVNDCSNRGCMDETLEGTSTSCFLAC